MICIVRSEGASATAQENHKNPSVTLPPSAALVVGRMVVAYREFLERKFFQDNRGIECMYVKSLSYDAF